MAKETKKLFLSGGGSEKDSFELDNLFIKSLTKKKILYIPLAANLDTTGYKSCYAWITATLAAHSEDFLKIIMSLNLENVTSEELNRFGAVYIGGGNTYNLLKTFNDSKFSQKLLDYHSQGGIVYGGSAGAIILGKDVGTVEEENLNLYSSSKGLNLVNNYSIICHYSDELEGKVNEYVLSTKYPVIALPEKSGLIIKNNHAQVKGQDSISVFTSSQKIQYLHSDYIKFF